MKEGTLHLNSVDIRHGDCLEVLRDLPDNSVDSVVTDPPYGLSNPKPQQVVDVLKAWVTGDTKVVPAGKGFMDASWDGFVPPPAVWDECLRVLKPGGHMAVFAGARTQDLMGLSIRLAGFEIRDTLGWIYGSGFPKSMDVSKAIDRAAGAERTVLGPGKYSNRGRSNNLPAVGWSDEKNKRLGASADSVITAPATPDAARWDGWGTALKPAIEPIILARKPLVGTVAQNVLAHGTGGLNIDACRVGMSDADREYIESRVGGFNNTRSIGGNGAYSGGKVMDRAEAYDGSKGRFPANVLLDEHAAAEMDKQSGHTGANLRVGARPPKESGVYGEYEGQATALKDHGDSGGASRFFPVFKSEEETPETKGRFPANVLLDEHAATEMDKQSGVSVSRAPTSSDNRGAEGSHIFASRSLGRHDPSNSHNDSGGASRFFPVFKYQAKAPKKERPVIEREDGSKIQHPTVKPVALMEWLVTLITPPCGLVLDPFAGTGTTLQAARDKGFRAIGVEQDPDYIKLINTRLETAAEDGGLF